MINPNLIKEKAEKIYTSFLTSIITGEDFFPRDFSVGKIPKEYIELRDAINQLIDASKEKLTFGYTVESESTNTRQYGSQTLPKRIYIDTELDYLRLLRKEKEVAQFKSNIKLIQSEIPQLYNWLCDNPKKVIDYAADWHNLLKVCHYFQQNPKPNLYIRELPIAVHTKFIEQNQKIIRSLLESLIESDKLCSIEGEKDHIFEKRFFLKYREALIRLRILDQSIKEKYHFPVTDLKIPISEFRQLNLGTHHVLITENLMNFLTLPSLKDTIAIFGSGYAVQLLKNVRWLSSCSIFYWGDLDMDGFKILAQVRSYFPQTTSLMMDMKTFETFHEFAVPIKAIAEPLAHLTIAEEFLYKHLTVNHLRLEQERISQVYVNQVLQNLAND